MSRAVKVRLFHEGRVIDVDADFVWVTAFQDAGEEAGTEVQTWTLRHGADDGQGREAIVCAGAIGAMRKNRRLAAALASNLLDARKETLDAIRDALGMALSKQHGGEG